MKITRDELLIAAFKLFMSVNYEKASFAELGKMLGMSKAGIFKYYKNKQELFIAVVDKFWFSTQNPRTYSSINSANVPFASMNLFCGFCVLNQNLSTTAMNSSCLFL